MRSSFLAIAGIFLGFPMVSAVNTDGRDPGSIPKLDIPEPPKWKDVDHPQFEPYPVKQGSELLDGAILEQFDGPVDKVFSRWKVCGGDWKIEEPYELVGFNGDNGLVLKSEQTNSAILRPFSQELDTTSGTKPFVVQYEVKTQKSLRCGGAYLKLLPPATVELNNGTSYVVMFGPDVCGATNKVHFIIKDQDGTEHHLQRTPTTSNTLLTTLYTLIIQPDQTFEIRRDGIVIRSGSLLDSDEFDPPLVPPREIADENDKKPADWEDEETIPDPEQLTKPDDWDENEPSLIEDPNAVKPEGWHEDWPLYIPDPDAVKPAEWDDEEDGKWVPREILNPKCANLDSEAGEGCGKWTSPLIRNPKYKGKWKQPYIANPKYKGPWAPRKIANPEFDESKLKPNKLSRNIGAVGFELMTVQGDILFDNLYIGHSVVDAENIGNATWSPKYLVESKAREKAIEANRAESKKREASNFSFQELIDSYRLEFEDFRMDPYWYVMDTYDTFINKLRYENKFDAIKLFPITFILSSAVLCILTSITFGLLNVFRAKLFRRRPVSQQEPVRQEVDIAKNEPAAAVEEK